MKKSKYISAFLLSVVACLIASCDAMYVVRGRVSEWIQEPQLSENHLNDVAIHVKRIDKKGFVKPVVEHPLTTDTNGKYQITFIGSPFGLGHDVYLEFIKPGYVLKRIFIEDEKQADATVTRCKDTSYKRCWNIDVILNREN